MTQEQKIQLIKDNSGAIIASLNGVLDATYELREKYLDENDNLKEGLTPDDKLVDFIRSIQQDTSQYESVRQKLIDGDFNMSLTEIARAGLALMFIRGVMDKQLQNIKEGMDKADLLIKQLMDETENVDFSQK